SSRVLTMAVALALLLSSAGGIGIHFAGTTSAAPLAAGKTALVVARDLSDGKTLDPGRSYEFSASAVQQNVYDELVTYKGTNTSTPVPALATSWTVSKNARFFYFHLRHGVRFSNGDPMTAQDVVFSYRRLGYLNDNPAFLMGAHTVGKRVVINGVKALGKYTVEFTLPTPDVSFLAALADVNFGVLDSKVIRAHGGVDGPNAATADHATNWLNNHSAGTGPFVITNWTRGASGQIVLKRNPYFWGPRQSLNQIVFQGITNATTERLEVSRGTIDVAEAVDIDGAKVLRNDRNVHVVTGNTLDLIYMAMTTSSKVNKPLSNAKVRQAIRYALDYSGIVNGLLSGIGTQPNSMIPVGMLGNAPAFNNSIKPRLDVAYAKNLLKQAGYPNGFSVPMYYDGGVTWDGVSYDLLAPKVQHDLAAIGVNVKLTPEQDTVLLANYRAQKLPLVLYNWGVDFPDPNDYAGPFSPGGGPAARMWYTWDANLTHLATAADATSNRTRRAGLYHQIQHTWLQESPWIGLVQPQQIRVFHKGVTGYVYNAVNNSSFRNVKKTG
ncbi:MAG TPA: ABC transporter substrate-binding protein, partial [Chloroflexota bacterium]